jgi:hypothetical protein
MTTRPLDFSGLMPPERDACAIISYINKAGQPTHGNVQRTIEALMKMGAPGWRDQRRGGRLRQTRFVKIVPLETAIRPPMATE